MPNTRCKTVVEILLPTAKMSAVSLRVSVCVCMCVHECVRLQATQGFLRPAEHFVVVAVDWRILFPKNTSHTHTHTQALTNGLGREKQETETYIQMDQQLNYSLQSDSRCLGGHDSALVSAAISDQKFKNRKEGLCDSQPLSTVMSGASVTTDNLLTP